MVGSETPKTRATSFLGMPRSTAASTFNLRSFEYGFMPEVSHPDQPPSKPLSVPATEEVGSLGAVAHPKQLVGRAQVLLYGGLREVKVPAYLGVGESFDHVTQDLP